jgi:hypothetical protein
MSNPTKTDHWRDLAQLIGAEIPEEPAEPLVQAAAEAALSTEGPSEASPAPDIGGRLGEPTYVEQPPTEPAGESLPGAPAEPEKPAAVKPAREKPVAEKQVEAPPRTPPKVDRGHWNDLARSLGLEVPSEPELEPEPAPPVAEPAVIEAPAVELREVSVQEVAEEAVAPDAEPVAAPEVEAAPVDVFEREFAPRSRFEEPSFDFETPGVLDAIFDEEEPEPPSPAEPPPGMAAAVEPVEAPVERPAAEWSPPEEESAEPEELAEEEAEEEPELVAEAETAEEAAEPGDEERRGRRRRRRRRRRGQRRDEESGAEEQVELAEEAEKEPIEAEAEAEEALDDTEEAEDQEFDEEEGIKVKLKQIPTWSEAINFIISTNMEARAKNPSGGSRNKGRRGRR